MKLLPPDDLEGSHIKQRISNGFFVAIVGPSGAGKDSLINALQTQFAGNGNIVFAKRIITRLSDMTEDHASMSEEQFRKAESEGHFLLSWNAHSLSYGLPASLEQDLRANRIVIANISRALLPILPTQFENHFSIQITARPDILAERLRLRGRENGEGQASRLERGMKQEADIIADITIDNSGDMSLAVGEFASVVRALVLRASATVGQP